MPSLCIISARVTQTYDGRNPGSETILHKGLDIGLGVGSQGVCGAGDEGPKNCVF
jgi:hypothetical protein